LGQRFTPSKPLRKITPTGSELAVTGEDWSDQPVTGRTLPSLETVTTGLSVYAPLVAGCRRFRVWLMAGGGWLPRCGCSFSCSPW
jgi:hypothetical protein